MELMRNTTAKATSNPRRKFWADNIKRKKPTLGTVAPNPPSVDSYIWYSGHHLGRRKKGQPESRFSGSLEVNKLFISTRFYWVEFP